MINEEVYFILISSGILIFFSIVLMIISIIFTIFWVYSIYDILVKQKFPKDEDKYIWLAIVLFGGFLGATIYFLGYKKSLSEQKSN